MGHARARATGWGGCADPGGPLQYLHSRALTWCSGTRWDFVLGSGFGFFSAVFLAVWRLDTCPPEPVSLPTKWAQYSVPHIPQTSGKSK